MTKVFSRPGTFSTPYKNFLKSWVFRYRLSRGIHLFNPFTKLKVFGDHNLIDIMGQRLHENLKLENLYRTVRKM